MKNIRLRKIKSSDFPYFLKWWRDKTLIRLTSGVFDYFPDEKLRNSFLKMLKDKKCHHYMILTSRGKIVGHLALCHLSKIRVEMQIVIGEKEYWGKGIGTEAVKKAFDIAFKKLKYQQIYIEVRQDNLRAKRLYQKCGFKLIGIKTYPKNLNLPKVLMMIKNRKVKNTLENLGVKCHMK